MTALATLWLYAVAVTLALCLALMAAFLCICAVSAGLAVRQRCGYCRSWKLPKLCCGQRLRAWVFSWP